MARGDACFAPFERADVRHDVVVQCEVGRQIPVRIVLQYRSRKTSEVKTGDALEAPPDLLESILIPRPRNIHPSVPLPPDNPIPHHDLVRRIPGCRVIGGEVEEELFGVPGEEGGEVGSDVEPDVGPFAFSPVVVVAFVPAPYPASRRGKSAANRK